jgi:hypothetical protein
MNKSWGKDKGNHYRVGGFICDKKSRSFTYFSFDFLDLRRFSSPRTKLLAARCECLHLIKINCLALWLDESAHACTRSELRGASCEDWKSALRRRLFFKLLRQWTHQTGRFSSHLKHAQSVLYRSRVLYLIKHCCCSCFKQYKIHTWHFCLQNPSTTNLSPGKTRKHCDSRCFLKCFHVCPPVETLLRKQNLLPGKQKCHW